MSMHQLMADPVARDIYATIPNNSDPETLADHYLLAKLENKPSTCLALECHLRDLARLHFDKRGVLEALQSMERHKARRKMGERAGADLKDIARNIEENYRIGWFKLISDGRVEFHINGLKIRCKDKPGAVALIVAKYRRGIPKRNWKARSTVCPPCNYHHKG